MREHLYRGKAINRDPNRTYRTEYKNGDWVFGLLSKLDKYGAEMTNEDGVTRIDVDPETICEFTGLTDKNKTKIFESDVVKATLSVAGEQSYAIGVVVFENGTFKLKVLQSKNTTEFKQYMGEDIKSFALEHNFLDRKYLFEVIGNIYDNPELLNRGAKMQ